MIRITIVLTLIITVLGLSKSHSKKFDGRIIGGHDADIADYPYQLSLQLLGFHFCGAVIVNSTWAVTAGHCVIGMDRIPLTIRAGSSNTTSGGQVINVKSRTVHPNYDDNTIDFDIALLELDEAITTESAVPIPLAETGIVAGSTAVVSGWGVIDNDDTDSAEILQVVEVPIIDHDICITTYEDEYISNNMFCAGLLGVGGKDACSGDSGGPVVVDKRLAGLVSWGYGCANATFPGVYTDIFRFVDWINEQM